MRISLKSTLIIFLFINFIFCQKIKTGIEVLKETNFKVLENKNVALITNQTGVDSQFNSTIDILFNAKNFKLKLLLAPEHGIRGEISAGIKFKNTLDPKTGLQIVSLYFTNKNEIKQYLKNIDVIIYDIQDVGSRPYTYISTMGEAMNLAAENNIEFIVLDRPNPLGGIRIEGNIPEKNFYSFISKYPIPYIYGLTCGELAYFINSENLLGNNLKCKLKIIKMKKWKRHMLFKDTGLMWIPTSPHILEMDTPFYFAATGAVGELNQIFNIGVGYTFPFKVIAVQNNLLNEKFLFHNMVNINGVKLLPIFIKPFYGNLKGNRLYGIKLYIKNFRKVDLIKIQFQVLEILFNSGLKYSILNKINPKQIKMFNLALGSDKYFKWLKNGEFGKIYSFLNKDILKFRIKSQKYYLYD